MAEHTEKSVLAALDRHYQDQYKYILHNAFVLGRWEMDWFGMNKREYVYEIEVKLTRGDFKADFKKQGKHERFKQADKEVVLVQTSNYQKWDHGTQQAYEVCGFCYEKQHTANRFFYCCPEGLLTKEDMPEYAGLLYVDEDGSITTIKKAPMIHKRKLDIKAVLLDKFYWRYVELKRKFENK